MSMTRLRMTLSIAVLALTLSAPFAMAQSPSDAAIQYRQKVMTGIGSSMGAIGDIVKNKFPFTGNISQHAKVIEINAGLIDSAFKQEAAEGKTDAKPAVWKE